MSTARRLVLSLRGRKQSQDSSAGRLVSGPGCGGAAGAIGGGGCHELDEIAVVSSSADPLHLKYGSEVAGSQSISCNGPRLVPDTDNTGRCGRVVRNRTPCVFRVIPYSSEEPLDVPDECHLHLAHFLLHFPSLLPKDDFLPEGNNTTKEIGRRDNCVVDGNLYRLAASERGIVQDIIDESMYPLII